MKKLVIILLFCILLTTSVFANGYNIFYYHNDHLGNPVAITNEDGEVVWKAEYEPFGEIFNEENIDISNKYNYNSKELDENTNLLYYGNRFYDSSIGRFTTADTMKGSLSAPQSLNRYVYVKNNPMKYVDLRGNQEANANELVINHALFLDVTNTPLDRGILYTVARSWEGISSEDEVGNVFFMLTNMDEYICETNKCNKVSSLLYRMLDRYGHPGITIEKFVEYYRGSDEYEEGVPTLYHLMLSQSSIKHILYDVDYFKQKLEELNVKTQQVVIYLSSDYAYDPYTEPDTKKCIKGRIKEFEKAGFEVKYIENEEDAEFIPREVIEKMIKKENIENIIDSKK